MNERVSTLLDISYVFKPWYLYFPVEAGQFPRQTLLCSLSLEVTDIVAL
jgi:hypothetical protein